MKAFLSILIAVAVIFVVYRIYNYYGKFASGEAEKERVAAQPIVPEDLRGLPSQLEGSLKEAEKGGATSLGKWLTANGDQVQDPRLAWIQLDYCEDLILNNPGEARRVFESVKTRTATNSPVYPRLRSLEKSFE